MEVVTCLGIEWLGLCDYDPAAPAPSYFTLGNAVTALAFTLAVQNFLKPIYLFRLRIRYVTTLRLYGLVFTGAFCCVIAAMVPRMQFLHGLPIGFAIVWELLATLFFLMAYGAVAIAAAVPVKVKPRRVPTFAQAAAQLISEAGESDRLELLRDLRESLPVLIPLAKFVEREPWQEEPSAFFYFIHRHKLEQASYAHSLLRIIADAPFCRTLVDRAPWVVSTMLRDIATDRLHSRAAESFVCELAQQALLSEEGMMVREMEFHGFGTAPVLSEALFGNPFIVTSYNTLQGLRFDKVNFSVLERFNSATVRTIETLIELSRTDHSYSAMGAMSFYRSAFMGLYAIQGAENYDFRHVMATTKSITNAIKLANKLMASASDGSYEWLYVDDLKDKHKYDVLGVLVEIVYDGLTSISNRFRGPNDPFWSMAQQGMSEAFKPIRQQPDGMTPFQQRLAILIVDGLENNMRGWYPSISRIVLATVGPYHENARQPNATAYNMLKDLAYLKLQKLPELATEHPEKLGDYFPDNIVYDAVGNTLTHTYFGGSTEVTELSVLQIAPINITDKTLRRPLTDDEREEAEGEIY